MKNKAVRVKVHIYPGNSEQPEKICATAEQAILFIQSEIVVNQHSIRHINEIFHNIYTGNDNKDGGYAGSFNAGNNSRNPLVSFEDVTGQSCVAELSPSNIKELCEKLTDKFKKRWKDYKALSYKDRVEIGFNWYWVPAQQRHYAIYEFNSWISSFESLEEMEKRMSKWSRDQLKKARDVRRDFRNQKSPK